ncbi:sister chromatid cohesion protein PDS5 homolog B [Tetranychus urticae]|uniref:Uncharacterized protein n=1 Tax=Tetranychus urticae TaxID=32264 RepID=T1L0F5_TETUR|nr:sister chromatid cohesion protein PDS5 homolog B [Tetranychus urticae]
MPKITGNGQSLSSGAGGNSNKLVYPPGCKDVNEELPTDDLIRRLKDIAMAFQQMSQEEDNTCYIPLALFLATNFFLEHQSRDVRLLVACAIADVFRVYAPNAPYQNPSLIKRIFLFFIQQLRGLQDPKDPTFKRYFYLLENLAWVKSFNICIELDDSQSIFCQLFNLIFKIVNDNHSDKVKNFMLDMLTPLIIEADAVSSKLVEIILWQLIDPKKKGNKQACWLATQILKKANKTMEPYLITYFNNAITHGVHANAGELSDDEEDETQRTSLRPGSKSSNQTVSKENQTVNQLCDLLYELNQICPSVMDGILPQLEFKIRSNEERERCEFTKLLARLFSDKNSRLAEQYPELWKSFLGRFRDISVTVRMRCVQYSMHFLINHPELREDITEQLKQRQHDPDENVRYEVVMAIISAAKKGIENINEDLLSFVKERTLDKKFKIRREALFGMAQLYKQYNIAQLGGGDDDRQSSTDTNTNNSALKMLNWIKNKCLHNYYQTQLDDRLLVERILHTCLIPYNLPLQQRMKILYTFYVTIDAHAARAFNELLRQQQSVRKQVKEVLDLIKNGEKDEKDPTVRSKIQLCAKNLPEPVKADEFLTKLCHNLCHNPVLRHHMDTIVSSTSFPHINEDGSISPPPSCSVIETSVKEILKSLGYPVQTNSFYVIIKQLMERIAPVMIDFQGLIVLFNYVSDSLLGEGEMDMRLGLEPSGKRGLQLIHALSSVFPAIFYGKEIFTNYLLPFLWKSSDNPQIGEIVLQILTNVGGVQGSISSSNNGEQNSVLTATPWWATEDDFIATLVDKFVLKASSTKQAKYAIQCLNAIIGDDEEKLRIFAQILDQIKEVGLTLDSPYFRIHLVTIGMVATCGGHVFFPKLLRSIIQKYVVQNLLMKDQRLEEEVQAQEESEKNRDLSDPTVSYEFCCEEVKCKIEGIKLMVRWLYGLKLNTLIASPESQQEVVAVYQNAAMNTMRIMTAIVQNNGDLNEKGLAGTTHEKARLKLAAAAAMLKIVGNDSITATSQGDTTAIVAASSPSSAVITPTQWHTLATILLAEEEYVRDRFALKLHKGLISLSLGLEFLALFCLGGYYQHENPFKNKLRSYLVLNIAKRRDLVKSKSVTNLKAVLPDCIMPYVIHLLAYMPFYTQFDNVDQLEVVKNCLMFIIEPIALKNEQFSFSYYKKTFENIKTCVDRVSASAVPEADENGSNSTPTMATMTNYKIYCACDLALGLIMSKTQNFLLKDFPVQPSLPGKYFMVSPSAATNNSRCYLPTSMQFQPPKRCGLEAEILGKITKTLTSITQPQTVNAPAKTRQGKGASTNSSGDHQVVVITSENVIEEGGVVIEQESVENDTAKQATVSPAPTHTTTRSRKQDLGSMVSNDEKEIVEKRNSRRKQELIPTSTRPTRSSARNSDVSSIEVKISEDEDMEHDDDVEGDDHEDDSNAQDDDIESKIIEITGEEFADDIDDADAGATRASKRGRATGRASRSAAPTGNQRNSKASEDESSSPARKSARIARKAPSKRSPSPEMKPAAARGRRKARR